MVIKFSKDPVPRTDLKMNPECGEAYYRGRPVLLASRGRGVAVVQSLSAYEKAEEALAFVRAVVASLT